VTTPASAQTATPAASAARRKRAAFTAEGSQRPGTAATLRRVIAA
jgi:hypothetical protein